MKKKLIIIAEAGVNHNGDIEIAKKLIDVAVEAKVDYVKFQTFKSNKLVSKTASKANYQVENTGNNTESQLEMLSKLELSEANHYELFDYCKEKGIKFLSTAFDLDSLKFLKKIGVTLFKIPSGEITNLPYLKLVSELADEIIFSTGMCTISEVEEALKYLQSKTKVKITVLHCNTMYPTPFKHVNLNAMLTMKKLFNIDVGYSDHTLGIEVPIAAVALGATIIEKHFTLNRRMAGPDHFSSLEPKELIQMVKSIRNIELSLGDGVKEPSISEAENITIARKSIFLANDKNIGEIIFENDLIMLRPGDGISPMKMGLIIGKKANKNLKQGHQLSFEDIK